MRHARIAVGLRYLRMGWYTSIIFFFVIFAFFVGVAFVLAPIAPQGVNYGIYRIWGDSGLVVFGLAYVALSLWSIFWPERAGGVITTATISCIGIASSIPPVGAFLNITGIIFYGLVLATIFTPLARVHLLRRSQGVR